VFFENFFIFLVFFIFLCYNNYYQLTKSEILGGFSMEWANLTQNLETLIPEDIKQDSIRREDYMRGAKDLFDVIINVYGDDLK